MPFSNRLERLFGRFALPNLSLYLVVGQAFVFLSGLTGLLDPGRLMLVPAVARAGEWWRIATFLLVPPSIGGGLLGIVGLAFTWWIFYFMGSALEGHWGTPRYNLFILTGWLLTAGLSFLRPFTPVTNAFLGGSVFLAFAYLNPDFEILLFFVIPVKIRWIALLTWAIYGIQFVRGNWGERLQIAAAVSNIVLFFGRDIWLAAGLRARQIERGGRRRVQGPEVRHRCKVCGRTDVSDPQLDFRYCSKCSGDPCYCPEHIFNHEHVLGENEGGKSG